MNITELVAREDLRDRLTIDMGAYKSFVENPEFLVGPEDDPAAPEVFRAVIDVREERRAWIDCWRYVVGLAETNALAALIGMMALAPIKPKKMDIPDGAEVFMPLLMEWNILLLPRKSEEE